MTKEKLSHRRLIADTIEASGCDISGMDLFKFALRKFTGGEDPTADDRAIHAYWKFEWSGVAPPYVVDYCIDLIVQLNKPRNPKGKRARKLSEINRKS